MTREEAIRCLSVHSSTNGSGLCTDEQHYEAKQLAIKALEQEPILDKIRAEIDGIEINGRVDEHTLFIRTGEQVKQMTLDIIDKYRKEQE